MSPRFAEIPEYVLGFIRGHVLFPSSRPADEIRRGQESSRQGSCNSSVPGSAGAGMNGQCLSGGTGGCVVILNYGKPTGMP